MGQSQSHHNSKRKFKSDKSGRQGRSENPDISGSLRRANRINRDVAYGGTCVSCETEYDDWETHLQVCRLRRTRANPDASMDIEEPRRPQYGTEMHPSHPNFSRENPMTSYGFTSPRIPLQNAGYEEEASPSASDSVPSSYASQAPDSPPIGVSDAQAWDHRRGSTPRPGYLRPAAPFSDESSMSSEWPVPQDSERYFQRPGDRRTSYRTEDQFEDRGASRVAQNQRIQDYRGYPSSPASYGNAYTSGSLRYSYVTPDSLSPSPGGRIHRTPPATPAPQDDRGRERGRPRYNSTRRSSSRRSESRDHRGEEFRESMRSRARPPQSSTTRAERQGRRDERSRSRVSQRTEPRPPSRVGYDRTMASEERAAGDARYARDTGTSHAQSGREHSRRTERVVFPGDDTMYTPSYLQEMESQRFGELRYAEDEDDSDDHMFTMKQVQDMMRPRLGSGSQRSQYM